MSNCLSAADIRDWKPAVFQVPKRHCLKKPVSPVSGSTVTVALTSASFSSTRLSNLVNKFAPLHKYNVELFFTLPLMNLKPGESENLEFNWTESYGKLAKGEYRIIKSFTVQSDIPERFYVAAEFTINE